MPESTCDAFLLKLFEASSAPLDKTPGFGQLRSLRETLAPLARRTEFKDRAFQYHILAKQLLEEGGVSTQISATSAIPDEQTAVQVILHLAKLVQEESESVLEYRGLKGAGWIIAYARHILGLPVCILRSSSQTVPISGDFVNSKVFVYIFEDDNKCQIINQGVVRGLFLTQSLENLGDNAWVVDVGQTSILDIHIPKMDPIRKLASSIAESILCDFTQLMAKSLSYNSQPARASQCGLVPYALYCLPAIRRRARRCLELLGFHPLDVTAAVSESDHWSRYFEVRRFEKQDFRHQWQDSTMAGMTPEDFGPHLAAGPAWLEHDLGETTSCNLHQQAKEGEEREARLTEKAVRYIKFLMRIVEAVSWLAFTDWDQNLRTLSTSFVEDLDTWKTGFNLYERYLRDGYQSLFDPDLPTSMVDLCKSAIDLVIGGRQTWTPDFSDGKVLAFQHETIVFKLGVALNQTFDIEASFLHFIPGTIMTNGERQNRIYAYSPVCEPMRLYTTPRTVQNRIYKPANQFPSLSVSTRIGNSDDDVILQQHAVVGNDICSIPGPASAFTALLDLYVTEPCEHHYYEELKTSKLDALAGLYPTTKTSIESRQGALTPPRSSRSPNVSRSASPHQPPPPPPPGQFSRSDMQQGLYVAGTSSSSSSSKKAAAWSESWLQEVDQNPLGQWLAYQTCGGGGGGGGKGFFTVLQRHCCLECTCKRIEGMVNERPNNKLWQGDQWQVQVSRIVNGRLEGEEME